MIILLPTNTNSFLGSSSTNGLPAACDYASMYCNDTAYDAEVSKEREERCVVKDFSGITPTTTKSVCGKNLALRNKALLAFRDKCYPSFSLDKIALSYKPKDIRDYITLRVHPFNNACHRDLSVRGGSKGFWEAVIKWCSDR
ncbi:hypothetical protein [Nostoc sp. DedQUE07]|uniref:hypothetical protein n=1 Tax=Nostoc sp. DedQUE07 TaxID=3075392 RepID=UPI002AD25122|nr:hypothetical protein [Nostoc sp. DedQUE07]MDZ8132234.1 hypothetical protein [Nostoc sp. DedQUE07]